MIKLNEIVAVGGVPALVTKKGEAINKHMQLVSIDGSERVVGKLSAIKEYQTGVYPKQNRFKAYEINGVNGFYLRIDLPVVTAGLEHYENEAEKKLAVWALMVNEL